MASRSPSPQTGRTSEGRGDELESPPPSRSAEKDEHPHPATSARDEAAIAKSSEHKSHHHSRSKKHSNFHSRRHSTASSNSPPQHRRHRDHKRSPHDERKRSRSRSPSPPATQGGGRRTHSKKSRSRSPSPPATQGGGRRTHSKRSRSRSPSPPATQGGGRRTHSKRSRSRSPSPPATQGGGRRTHSKRSRSRSPPPGGGGSSSQRRRDRHSRSHSRSPSPGSRHRRDHSRRSPPSHGGKRPRDYRQHGWHRGGGYRGYHKKDRTSTPVLSTTPTVIGKDSSSQQPSFAPPRIHTEPDPNAVKLTPEQKLERALSAAQVVRMKMSQPSIPSFSTTPPAPSVPLGGPLLKIPPTAPLAQKKKLVWNKKSTAANQWESVSLGEEGEAQAKFRRLMGMGKGGPSSAEQSAVEPQGAGSSEMKEKHEKLKKDLEQQYEASRYMTHLAKGSGLGFGFSSGPS